MAALLVPLATTVFPVVHIRPDSPLPVPLRRRSHLCKVRANLVLMPLLVSVRGELWLAGFTPHSAQVEMAAGGAGQGRILPLLLKAPADSQHLLPPACSHAVELSGGSPVTM